MVRILQWVARQAQKHPYITLLFGFWAFGYTFMVPTLFGGRMILFIAHLLGDTPKAWFLGFGFLFLNVFVFAFLVPFALWALLCWALQEPEEGASAEKEDPSRG